jgi:polysaccharide pyruvyl transferase WcaK-like protein/sulfatase maturation enzyme AslB (radical SAM superfamily)
MCRIWENKQAEEISPDQLRKGLRNPLYSEVTSVGINGGEPTLRKDLAQLVEVLYEEMPRLRTVSMITNAYRYREVIERVAQVGEVVQRRGGRLDVMVSLDGVGDLHDRVRGKPRNFQRAQFVIDAVKKSPLVHNVRIGCTIIKENVHGLADLHEYCVGQGVYVKYRLGIPHKRLYTQNLLDPYALTADDKYHVAEFLEGVIAHYEQEPRQRFFYRSLVDQLVRGAPRKAGCDWQHRGATITSKGELLYCAVQSRSLGHIVSQDSEALYFGNQPHLAEIVSRDCGSCHHDYVGVPPRGQLAREIGARLVRATRSGPMLRGVARMRPARWLFHRRRFEQRLASFRARAQEPMPWPSHDPSGVKVLICGWYGTETLGDKAILGGVVHSARQAFGECDFVLSSLHPYVSEATRRQMPELKGIRIVDPATAVRHAASADVVLFGGGPLMALDELAEMEAIFEAAHRAQVPRLVAGCGVGPLGDPWHNDSLRRILTMATARIYRDAPSRETARILGVDVTGDVVAEDPALTWLHERADPGPRSPNVSAGRVLLLGLREFPHQQYARHLPPSEALALKRRAEEQVVQALQTLVERHPDVTVRPLPMCTNHFGDDDRWFYRRLFRGHPSLAARLDLSLLGAELPPEEYAQAFRAADAVVAMRFHALVFALGCGTPSVAIDYTLGKGKVWALAERHAVPCRSLSEVNATQLVADIERALDAERPAPVSDIVFPAALGSALRRLVPERP